MDEHLEHAIEGSGEEAAVRREEALPFAGGENTEEKTEETTGQEEGMNPETKPDEAEVASDEGLPDAEAEEPGAAEATGETGGTAEDQPVPGMVVQPRDYYAEWQELAEAHPEVVGKELPEDIYQACMKSELPPLRVYESMMLQKQSEQIAALQQEIATLRQNAENTARAPVVAAAEGPANEPEDLFIRDLFSY